MRRRGGPTDTDDRRRITEEGEVREETGLSTVVEEQITVFVPLCWLLNRLYCNEGVYFGGGAHMKQIVG